MSLTNTQLEELAKKIGITLEKVCFRDELDKEKLVYNAGYIINLESAYNEDNQHNPGSH